jgi:hypothetical protein
MDDIKHCDPFIIEIASLGAHYSLCHNFNYVLRLLYSETYKCRNLHLYRKQRYLNFMFLYTFLVSN